MHRVLVINPGSTSSKIAVFDDQKEVFTRSIRHEAETEKYPNIMDQMDFRKGLILTALQEENIPLESLSAVVGRGGLLHPMEGGTYHVTPAMLEDLSSCRYGEHASNLGGILADAIAKPLGVPAYIADPVVVDEKIPEARLSGWPGIERLCISHPLNQKAVAKRYAREHNGKYQDFNFIVAHMGGGLSVGAHEHGRIIDVNNALDGDGPFSAERTGGLPLRGVMDMCFSGEYTRHSLQKAFIGHGGLYAYLGTKDGLEIIKRIEAGDEKTIAVIKAQAYQVAKEIGGCAAALKGKVDAILLTGGLAYNKYFTDWIKERVEFIAEVVLYPGEDEMGALALAACEALTGEIQCKRYEDFI